MYPNKKGEVENSSRDLITEDALSANNSQFDRKEFKEGLGSLYPEGLTCEQAEFIQSFVLIREFV